MKTIISITTARPGWWAVFKDAEEPLGFFVEPVEVWALAQDEDEYPPTRVYPMTCQPDDFPPTIQESMEDILHDGSMLRELRFCGSGPESKKMVADKFVVIDSFISKFGDPWGRPPKE